MKKKRAVEIRTIEIPGWKESSEWHAKQDLTDHSAFDIGLKPLYVNGTRSLPSETVLFPRGSRPIIDLVALGSVGYEHTPWACPKFNKNSAILREKMEHYPFFKCQRSR